MLQKLDGVVLHVVRYSDKSNIVHIYTCQHGSMSFVIPATRSRKSLVNGLLEGICTDGSRLLASLLSRQLAECVQPGHGAYAAHSAGTDNDCIDLSGHSGEKQRYSAVYLLPVLMRVIV